MPEGVTLDPIANAPGYFRAQKVRNGAWLPARMWIEEQRDETGGRIGDDLYCCEIGMERVDAFNPPNWPYGWERVGQGEWEYLFADLVWCQAHKPSAPIANPDRPAREAKREFF